MAIEIILTCERCGNEERRQASAGRSSINLDLNSDTGKGFHTYHENDESFRQNNPTLLCSDCMKEKEKIVEKHSKECAEEIEQFMTRRNEDGRENKESK